MFYLNYEHKLYLYKNNDMSKDSTNLNCAEIFIGQIEYTQAHIAKRYFAWLTPKEIRAV